MMVFEGLKHDLLGGLFIFVYWSLETENSVNYTTTHSHKHNAYVN